jgi:DNA (cytosine-5)-methyltransferase 1
MAFEEAGFCVVRGPDLLWGGDVRRFHPPAGKFDGVIGGPPCQLFSRLALLNPHAGKHGNLIPEFERCVREAEPTWFLMENVKAAPEPNVAGFEIRSLMLNNRWLGEEQTRLRRFSFGSRTGADLAHFIEVAVFEAPLFSHAVTSNANPVPVALGGNGKRKATARPPTVLAGHGPVGRGGAQWETNLTLAEASRLQGLPEDFLVEAPFTSHGKRAAIGNGVPLPMGRAIAKAVVRLLEAEGV